MTLSHLSTQALFEGLTALVGSERRTVAEVVAHLAEVEARDAHLEAGYPSLFDFCLGKLGLSEGEAFRRINAARSARRFPRVLEMLADGRMRPSGLVLLRDHLTEENHVELLHDASGRSQNALRLLLAGRAPKPDVPDAIQELPSRALLSSAVEPLSSDRYRAEFTASAQLEETLERAATLMSHHHAERGLAQVVERGLDLLIAALEKDRFGKVERPQAPRAAGRGRVTRASEDRDALRYLDRARHDDVCVTCAAKVDTRERPVMGDSRWPLRPRTRWACTSRSGNPKRGQRGRGR